MDIIHWIDAIQPVRPMPESDTASLKFEDAAPRATRKRKTRRPFDNESDVLDPEATPRPWRRSSSTSIATSSDTRSRSTSRASSSIRRRMMRLRTDAEGINFLSLKDKTIPDVDNSLFNTMTQYGRCQQIIPDTLREYITRKLENNKTLLSQWQYSYKSGADNLPGRIPTFEDIQKLLAKAAECDEHKHSEASWIAEFHLPLLHCIYENNLIKQRGSFNAMLCNTAKPHGYFKPISSNSKMIDICVYASLDQDNEIAARNKFSMTSPTLSINHTDFEPMQFRPFIISIATEKSDSGDMAQLQIGVWLATQWKFLHWAVNKKLHRERRAQSFNTPATDGEEEVNEAVSAVLTNLPFIPGIIILGNAWKLVISTYADGKTTLWSGSLFGKTESLLDIYAIVAGVRKLTAWGRGIYLPWFKDNILTLE